MASIGEVVGTLRLHDRFSRPIKDAESQFARSASNIGRVARRLAVSIGGIAIARNILNTGMAFEQLRAQLETVTGSADAANRAFSFIKQFAKDTPFEVRNLTTAFTLMKAKGLEPTADTFRKVGNLAAAFGKDILDAERAVTGAMFGEMEALKQFGIIIRQQTDTATVTFRGHTQTIQKDAASIRDAILSIADTHFDKAMERQMGTAVGAVSNLKDAWDNFSDTLVQTGALDAFTDAAKSITRAIEQINGALKRSGFSFSTFFRDVRAGLAQMVADVIRGTGMMLARVAQLIGTASIKFARALQQAPGFIRAILDPTGGGRQSALQVANAMATLVETVTRGANDMASEWDDAAQILLSSADATTTINDTLDTLSDNLSNTVSPAVSKAREKIAELERGLRNLKRQLDVAQSGAANFGNQIDLSIPSPGSSIDFGGMSFGLVDDLTRELERRFPKLSSRFAEHLSAEVERQLGDALLRAIDAAFSGDFRALVTGAFTDMMTAAGAAIGGVFGGPKGMEVGALIGSLVGEKVASMFGGNTIEPQFVSVINLLSGAATRLEHAARDLADAARHIRERFLDLSRSLGGFLSISGDPLDESGGAGGRQGEGGNFKGSTASAGGLLSLIPDLQFVVNQTGDLFHASLEGLVSGVGSSLQDAVRNMFDTFAQRLSFLIEQGRVSLAGVPEVIADVLRNAAFQTFEDLQQAIETATRFFLSSIGERRADLFNFFADLRVAMAEAIRIGLDASTRRGGAFAEIQNYINQLAGISAQPLIQAGKMVKDFRQSLEGLGLTAAQVARAVDRFKDAIRAANLEMKSQVFGVLASWAKELGVNAGIQRRAARLSLRLEFLKLKLTAQTLGIWNKVRDTARDLFRGMLDQINKIGEDLEDSGKKFTTRAEEAGDAFKRRVEDAVATIPDPPTPQDIAKWVDQQVAALDRFLSSGKSPIEQLIETAVDLAERFPSRIGQISQKANQALDQLVGQIQRSIREFRESLKFGPFGVGTPQEKADDAFTALQDAVAALFAGDLSQLANIQNLADLAIQLGAAAGGTSTQDYLDLVAMIDALLEQVETADFNLDVESGEVTAINTLSDVTTSQHVEDRRELERQTGRVVDGLASLATLLRQPTSNPV